MSAPLLGVVTRFFAGADSFQLSVPTLGHTTRIYARAPPLTDCFQSAPYNEAEECIPLKPRNGDKARAFLDKVSMRPASEATSVSADGLWRIAGPRGCREPGARPLPRR
eukprot:scaffold7052_cov254-Pinguiococcus_pyrenoidosus.AAC.45